jgi:hypothetical protein
MRIYLNHVNKNQMIAVMNEYSSNQEGENTLISLC